MKKKFMGIALIPMLCFSLMFPTRPVRADFWGGDVIVLSQILMQTIQQLAQLRQIFSNGRDTLGLLRDINEGIREAMGLMRTMNTTIQPGVLSQLQSADQVLRAVQDFYGRIPKTPEGKMQQLNDQSVAEAITLHNQAFKYAEMIDPEAERIKDYSRGVSPAGAGRLTAQSLGVLIHVTNQILRTNAAMLKIMSEHFALQNKKEKLNSEQFMMQYEGISSAIRSAPSLKESMKLSH